MLIFLNAYPDLRGELLNLAQTMEELHVPSLREKKRNFVVARASTSVASCSFFVKQNAK